MTTSDKEALEASTDVGIYVLDCTVRQVPIDGKEVTRIITAAYKERLEELYAALANAQKADSQGATP